jgi:hypothetical protein
MATPAIGNNIDRYAVMRSVHFRGRVMGSRPLRHERATMARQRCNRQEMRAQTARFQCNDARLHRAAGHRERVHPNDIGLARRC